MEKNKKNYAEIGERLTWIRETFTDGLTQNEFAKAFNWEQQTYNSWETGERRISIPRAVVLCEKYDLSLDFIYRGKTSVLPINIAKLYASYQQAKK